ncbi:MAG TPA: insulinase family protein [Spirochaetia bacterium]|nr:insulinase family protein [Spirochaetia bacterium]
MELTKLKTGDKLHGFEVLDVRELTEYRANGVLLRHMETGCEVYHVLNDDEENLFSFTFRTLPPDSKGAAHILEHTVLCGSERYPLKDPFVLLIKGSLNTFLNAFTFPDKTVYPVASTVEKDLFNLMQVYGDAVFFPLLRKEMFRQEGSRLQFNERGELEVTGVVYNEMKGNYSTHEAIASEWAFRSLFPDTPYHYDSGGEPASIRDLTYEEFIEFHRTFYHPSNALVFLYGNIPTERYLAFLQDQFLSRFKRLDVHVTVPVQPRWTAPIEKTVSFPAQSGDGADEKSSVTVNWLLSDVTDPMSVLQYELLSEMLLGDSGAPLEKALIESGLGEDLSPPTGLETELRELIFSVGLRGTDPDRRADIEKLIFSTLGKLSSEGLDPELVEGVLRRVEFRNREIKGSPFGLRLMRRMLRGWLHGTAPEATLEFAPWFGKLRGALAENPRLFEELIRTGLIENQHRSTLTVVPDTGLQEREQAELTKWLAERDRALDEESRKRLKADQAELAAFQEAPDSAEAVQALPFLHVADLPEKVELIRSRTERMLGGVPFITHEFFTNGIVYLDICVDVSGLSPSLSALLPLYTSAFRDCGLPGVPYDALATQLSLLVGGFSSSLEANIVYGADGAVKQHVFFRIKMLESHVREALVLVRRVLLEADFTNTRRVRDLFLELRNDFKSSLIPNGHAYVSLRTERAFSRSDAVEENWRGITRMLALSGVSPDRDIEKIGSELIELRNELMRLSRFSVNVTCSGSFLAPARDLVRDFLSAIPAGTAADLQPVLPDLPAVPRYESIVVPSAVGYVGQSLPASAMGSPAHAHEVVIAHLLKTGYLWEQIRMKGGAYGAFASANGLGRMFTFASYRDPNIVATLRAFRDSLATFASTADSRTVELGIIGTVGRDLRPYSPGEKGLIGFKRHLYGITDEVRQVKRDQILGTTTGELASAADRLLSGMESAVVAVMSGNDALNEACKELPGLAEHRIEIP